MRTRATLLRAATSRCVSAAPVATASVESSVANNAPSLFYNSTFYKGFFLGKIPGFTQVYPANWTGLNYVNTSQAIVIFKSNNYDAVSFKLTAADGSVEVEATDPAKKREWTFPGVPQKNVDSEKVKRLLECFDKDNKAAPGAASQLGLVAEQLVAEVTSASLVSYGLEPARKLAISVEPYSPDAGAKKRRG